MLVGRLSVFEAVSRIPLLKITSSFSMWIALLMSIRCYGRTFSIHLSVATYRLFQWNYPFDVLFQLYSLIFRFDGSVSWS